MMFHPANNVRDPDAYCAVKSLVENNLPNASTLQYSMGFSIPIAPPRSRLPTRARSST